MPSGGYTAPNGYQSAVHEVSAVKLSHYSRNVVSAVRSVPQGGPAAGVYKPCGFWVSVDGEQDWAAWCADENWGLGPIRHRVTLAHNHGCLILQDVASIRQFHAEFGIEKYRRYEPDWFAVARQYSGIIIAPYQWSLRLDSEVHWYYSWDCASGCIWNADAIASIATLEQVAA